MRQFKATWIIIIALLAGLLFLFFMPWQWQYSALTKAKVKPHLEWELSRTLNGNLLTKFTDHYNNKVKSYSVTEFTRGDVVEFRLFPGLVEGTRIEEGDTIGFIYSNEEQRKLIELLGSMEILNSEYLFYTTGQKPEDADMAERRYKLAEQELATQKKLMARSEVLFQDSVISLQEYEIDLNELRVKELAYSIAEAHYRSVTTGDKPEQALLIESKIQALAMQIEQVQSRLAFFTLISPVSGQLVYNRKGGVSGDGSESIVKIMSTDQQIGVAPIRIQDQTLFRIGDEVELISLSQRGKLIAIDNVAQGDWAGTTLYVTFILEPDSLGAAAPSILPGSIADIKIKGPKLSSWDYLSLLLQRPS